MELVRPSEVYESSYLAALKEFQSEGQKTDIDIGLAEKEFGRFVRELFEHEEGKHMKTGYLPETVYWLVEGGEYIGRISIRHRLNEHLLQIGGHIGYDIRPSMRKRGYGTEILRLALPKAKELGIARVLLTCDETNVASRRIIEKNGGVLENKVPNTEGGPDKLRFWIDLSMV